LFGRNNVLPVGMSGAWRPDPFIATGVSEKVTREVTAPPPWIGGSGAIDVASRGTLHGESKLSLVQRPGASSRAQAWQ